MPHWKKTLLLSRIRESRISTSGPSSLLPISQWLQSLFFECAVVGEKDLILTDRATDIRMTHYSSHSNRSIDNAAANREYNKTFSAFIIFCILSSQNKQLHYRIESAHWCRRPPCSSSSEWPNRSSRLCLARIC